MDYPLVSSCPDGDPFALADILADEDAGQAEPSPRPEAVADLAFLRTPLEGITVADVETALAHLDPDMGMQQWIEVGAAMKHQFDAEEAYQSWDAWSAKGKKYDSSEETRYRWNSLKAQPTDRMPVTIRSLFKAAQARGWVNATLAHRQRHQVIQWLMEPRRTVEELMEQGPKRIAKSLPTLGDMERATLYQALRDGLMAHDINLTLTTVKKDVLKAEGELTKATGLLPWAKGLCYVTSLNLFYRPSTDRRFLPEVVDLMYAIPPSADDKALRPRDYLIQVAQVPQVENLRYSPAMGGKRFYTLDSVPFVNTYRPDFAPPEPDRADEAGEIFWDHLCKLVKEPEYQHRLMDWLAYPVQHPGKKIRWAPLIQSTEGAGKTALAGALKAVLGRRNTAKLRASDVMEGQHNSWAYGKQVVTIEEVRIVGANRHAVMDKLKPLITDDEIGLHKKFEDHRTVDNATNYLLFTNYHDALAVTEDSRRYFVLTSPIQRPEDVSAIGGKEHFDRLYAMIRDNPGGLRAWFEQWSFSPGFEPEGRAPVTPYLHTLAENSASPLSLAMREVLADAAHPLVRGDLLSLSCLAAALDAYRLPPYTNASLASVLRESGWLKYGRVALDGSLHTLYTRGGVRDAARLAASRLEINELI